MAIYKLVKNDITEEIDSVTLTIDSNHKKSIPFVAANTDYQEYLKWCNGEDPYTEKGTPEAAD
tara:strand:- start:78 stop:266 length:189 start_codon:yes stop_codon:yes gene_type:complete